MARNWNVWIQRARIEPFSFASSHCTLQAAIDNADARLARGGIVAVAVGDPRLGKWDYLNCSGHGAASTATRRHGDTATRRHGDTATRVDARLFPCPETRS